MVLLFYLLLLILPCSILY